MPQVPLLLETIRLENGCLPHLAYHQKRLTESRAFHFGELPPLDLDKLLRIPDDAKNGLFKVRVVYGKEVEKIEILPYTIRPVRSLQLMPAGDLFYRFKYADRQALLSLFQQRDFGDDVLLIRDDLLTDTSYANVALFDGTKWWTPARPLLSGTARARYLDAGLLHPADIHYRDLKKFRQLKLINAMMEWEEGPLIDVDMIRLP